MSRIDMAIFLDFKAVLPRSIVGMGQFTRAFLIERRKKGTP